ncbi:MAG: amino acid permease [Verrucomicrobia bacterium]|nr:amino acid permease [Verrucomicrobiota bacterium]OQC64078.1 MAG: putative amino acid permease YhdG [Verrucomicrobia bacterium ADurb.Bin006]MDI9381904.1 amino acid permease [Verrucomicrobiota bacterium]NMD22280.1 amino acid permease [Verrucomicrobiota bacterium]HOA62502.1 amino acid permease [Verrucomicrobiota bacterium]
MNLFRRKEVADLQREAASDLRLHRALGPLNLTMLGIGAIVGTGIFVLTGTVAAQNAGPAVVLSFVLAGLASIFAALCYSEFASLVPMAGSAYTYGYATLGEFFAWIIGWDLILEYAVGAVTVAVGWSGYLVSFLKSVVELLDRFGASGLAATLTQAGVALAPFSAAHGVQVALPDGTAVTALFNLPAVMIVAIVTFLLVVGIKESARFNNVIVIVKLAVVLLFIIVAAKAIQTANWHPFIPPNTGQAGHFGISGVLMGAGVVFFAYIGFDAVSTAAQEAKNPQRDMPIGIIGSLLICTLLYILVSGVATGVVPYGELDVPDPIAKAADRAQIGWMAVLIKVGALAGLSSVILVLLYGQSRVFFAMSRDGLLPPFVNLVHPRYQTPWLTSIVTGIGVAFFGALFSVREAGSLCSIGTLLAFVIVSVGIMILRVRHPELRPRFRTPWVWVVAPCGAISALVLMFSLPWPTWERLIVWFAIGMVVFFAYGVYHSKLGSGGIPGETSWSRALKVVGLSWMILGSLAAIIWIARYREASAAVLPGASGWLVGILGMAVSVSIGIVLNLLAQVSDHLRARREHAGGVSP